MISPPPFWGIGGWMFCLKVTKSPVNISHLIKHGLFVNKSIVFPGPADDTDSLGLFHMCLDSWKLSVWWEGVKNKTFARGRILGRNWDKSLKSFPPCCSLSPPQSTHRVAIADSGVYPIMIEKYQYMYSVVTSTNGFYPPPPPPPPNKCGLKLVSNVHIIYRNLKSENSLDNAQKLQRNCTFMNSASGDGGGGGGILWCSEKRGLYGVVAWCRVYCKCRKLNRGIFWIFCSLYSAESYQNYQNWAVSNRLTVLWGVEGSVLGG